MPREERERRYIQDFLLQNYPRGGWVTNVPLGPIPQEILARYGVSAGAKLFRPSRPRVDAVLLAANRYFLVEAKIREPKAAIGDLLVYKSLAEKTPDLPIYNGEPISMMLVVPWALDWVKIAARQHDMHLVEFRPAWVEDYVRMRQDYFTRDWRMKREEIMRLRRSLGVE